MTGSTAPVTGAITIPTRGFRGGAAGVVSFSAICGPTIMRGSMAVILIPTAATRRRWTAAVPRAARATPCVNSWPRAKASSSPTAVTMSSSIPRQRCATWAIAIIVTPSRRKSATRAAAPSPVRATSRSRASNSTPSRRRAMGGTSRRRMSSSMSARCPPTTRRWRHRAR